MHESVFRVGMAMRSTMHDSAGNDLGSDDALIAAVQVGDVEAFAGLVTRYQQRLFVALAPCCRGADEADDLVQEAFVRAFRRIHDFRSGQPFYPWLKTIALNQLRDRARRSAVAAEHRPGLLEQWRRQHLDEAVNDDDEACLQALRRCVNQMDAQAAALVEARYGQGLELSELAHRHGSKLGAMKMRLLRLRQALRECVERRLTGARP